jgi:peptide/nickel transport system substrate-binding protein
MGEVQRRIDRLRRGSRNEIESHIVDEYVAGRIDRREFFRRGTVMGMSLPMLSLIAAACGGGGGSNSGGGAAAASSTESLAAPGATAPASTSTGPAGKSGGTVRLSVRTPTGAIEPLSIADQGGLCVLAQTGEFLCYEQQGVLSPGLAESWSPSADVKEWTFKIRSGVKFNDGTPMTAKDAAASINLHADPANKGNALSAFTGVVSKGAASAPDDTTVVVKLDAPNANFPYYLSNTNYNVVILPATFTPGSFQKSFPGTGPWKLESFRTKQGAKFVRNEDYWGEKALPDRLEITFAADEQPAVLALQGNQVDVVDQVSVSGSPSLIQDPNFTILAIRASTHRELSMRCDTKPFDDKRVRQAVALTLDRPGIVQGLFAGKSDLGNDNPFAPVFAQTDRSVPQRNINLDMAKQLLKDAGHEGGFSTQMNVNKTLEMPQYAQLVADAASKIGIKINLVVQDGATYYGDAVYGKSPWLDSIMSMVDYGHRGVPNVFLAAPLQSKGTWNAAHYKNPTYDKLSTDFIAEKDLAASKKLAGQIEKTLLDDTPIIFAYFYQYLTATSQKIKGVRATAMGQVWVDKASVA